MKRTLLTLLAVFLCLASAGSQEQDYFSLYNNGEYKQALDIVDKKLNDIYSTRVEDKRVPSGFITLKNTDRDIDLMKVFRQRKAKGFFIEDNSEISTLHLYGARCSAKLLKPENALNHYYQCLRFRHLENKRDDAVFFEMAQIFREAGHFKAYVSFLEAAYSLNTEEYRYSRELGTALYTTAQKKRAIFHLERYIANVEGKPEPELLLMTGNLYEDIGRYLDTEKYYIRYLEAKPDDGFIHFALGHNAYKRTGNYELALKSLDRALSLLPESDIIRRSKAHEYRGDMAFNDLEYDDAIANYTETLKYQEKIAQKIKEIEHEIGQFSAKINDLKTSLLKESDFDEYELYEYLKEERAKKELELVDITRDYSRLNAGRVRWFLAEAFERKERYNDAITYYRQAITFDYNSGRARDRIVKLQLKIKRGY
ncbi:MAG TPA: tetratricopeptide repeat protein [Spirochaetota bacterium]|nr:tetratricopeptide repeat protein [Spirochaetota bacterium]HPI89799.1 tetratricopeptide repeat protein [Spirochaetota bacterium]HPR47560.1 tetratricopeptide repeat protein [Spirochaetota bacterium]